MYTQRSDTSKNTAASHKATVRQFLRAHDEVASKDKLRAGTDVPAWYIDQIASTNTFYTSLNHNGQYVAANTLLAIVPPMTASGDPRWMTASPSSTARKPPKPRSSISRSSDLLGSLPRSKRPPRSTLLPCAPEPRRPTGDPRCRTPEHDGLRPQLAVPAGRPAEPTRNRSADRRQSS